MSGTSQYRNLFLDFAACHAALKRREAEDGTGFLEGSFSQSWRHDLSRPAMNKERLGKGSFDRSRSPEAWHLFSLLHRLS